MGGVSRWGFEGETHPGRRVQTPGRNVGSFPRCLVSVIALVFRLSAARHVDWKIKPRTSVVRNLYRCSIMNRFEAVYFADILLWFCSVFYRVFSRRISFKILFTFVLEGVRDGWVRYGSVEDSSFDDRRRRPPFRDFRGKQKETLQ